MSKLKLTTIANITDTENTNVTNVINGSAKAWVNFSVISGTPTIVTRFNVASITDDGTGAYTINFTSAMVDANYVSFISTEETGVETHISQTNSGYDQAAGALKIRCNLSGTSTNYDPNQVNVIVFR